MIERGEYRVVRRFVARLGWRGAERGEPLPPVFSGFRLMVGRQRNAPELPVHLFRDVLTLHLDFALVLPGLCEIVGKLHPQRFLCAAECFR